MAPRSSHKVSEGLNPALKSPRSINLKIRKQHRNSWSNSLNKQRSKCNKKSIISVIMNCLMLYRLIWRKILKMTLRGQDKRNDSKMGQLEEMVRSKVYRVTKVARKWSLKARLNYMTFWRAPMIMIISRLRDLINMNLIRWRNQLLLIFWGSRPRLWLRRRTILDVIPAAIRCLRSGMSITLAIAIETLEYRDLVGSFSRCQRLEMGVQRTTHANINHQAVSTTKQRLASSEKPGKTTKRT